MGSHEGSQQYQEMQNSHLISLIVSCFPGNFGLSLVVLKLAEWKLTDIEWLHLTHWLKRWPSTSPQRHCTPPPTQHITVRLCRNKLLTSYLYSACPYQNVITLQMLNPSSYTTPPVRYSYRQALISQPVDYRSLTLTTTPAPEQRMSKLSVPSNIMN